tara:strand:- start:548 stop:1231 length:684 start_codon:yes stop_codon:yes gene_type:complete
MLFQQINNINTDWKEIILKSTELDDLNTISYHINEEKKIYEPSLLILPEIDKIFQAFKYFNFDKLKLVIIGQDCYHGKGQANGLAFSVDSHIDNPPSLKNILKEISNDLQIERKNSNFEDLAKQGILFLNAALTVREKCPESHSHIWREFTDNLIKKISDMSENIIFVLWGNFARAKKSLIDTNKHFILESVHPSPLSAYRGFFGCKHFSQINNKLIEWGKDPINWN